MQTYDALENFIMTKNREEKDNKKAKKSPINSAVNVSDIMNTKTPQKKSVTPPKIAPKTAEKLKPVPKPAPLPKPVQRSPPQAPRPMPIKKPVNDLQDLPDDVEVEEEDAGLFDEDTDEDAENPDELEPEYVDEDAEGEEEQTEFSDADVPENEEDILEPYEKYSEQEDRPQYAREEDQMSEEMEEAEDEIYGRKRVIKREIPKPLLQQRQNAISTPIKRLKQMAPAPLPTHVKRTPPSNEAKLSRENEELKNQLARLTAKKQQQPVYEEEEEEQYEEPVKKVVKRPNPEKRQRPEKKSLFSMFKKKEAPERPVQTPPKKYVQPPQQTMIPQKKYAPSVKDPKPAKKIVVRVILALVGMLITGMGIWLTTSPKVVAGIPYLLQIGIVLIAMGVNLILNEL